MDDENLNNNIYQGKTQTSFSDFALQNIDNHNSQPKNYENNNSNTSTVNIASTSDKSNNTDVNDVKTKPKLNELIWDIIGIIIDIILIIGALSGTLVLRGTNSSEALLLVASLLLIYELYRIYRKTSK